MERIRFGTVATMHTMDDNGSTVTTVTNFRDFSPVGSVKDYYEDRRKVTNMLEQSAEINRFTKQTDEDAGMLDPEIRIEGKNAQKDYYYVVLCYKRIRK